jgi:hypothetical protein
MPGQQDVELLGRLVGYPVADTLEHLERVWARDEPRGERGALGSERVPAVAVLRKTMQEKYRRPVDRPSVTHVENEPVPGKTGDPLCAHQTPFSATTRRVAREVTDPGGKFPAFVL